MSGRTEQDRGDGFSDRSSSIFCGLPAAARKRILEIVARASDLARSRDSLAAKAATLEKTVHELRNTNDRLESELKDSKSKCRDAIRLAQTYQERIEQAVFGLEAAEARVYELTRQNDELHESARIMKESMESQRAEGEQLRQVFELERKHQESVEAARRRTRHILHNTFGLGVPGASSSSVSYRPEHHRKEDLFSSAVCADPATVLDFGSKLDQYLRLQPAAHLRLSSHSSRTFAAAAREIAVPPAATSTSPPTNNTSIPSQLSPDTPNGPSAPPPAAAAAATTTATAAASAQAGWNMAVAEAPPTLLRSSQSPFSAAAQTKRTSPHGAGARRTLFPGREVDPFLSRSPELRKKLLSAPELSEHLVGAIRGDRRGKIDAVARVQGTLDGDMDDLLRLFDKDTQLRPRLSDLGIGSQRPSDIFPEGTPLGDQSLVQQAEEDGEFIMHGYAQMEAAGSGKHGSQNGSSAGGPTTTGDQEINELLSALS